MKNTMSDELMKRTPTDPHERFLRLFTEIACVPNAALSAMDLEWHPKKKTPSPAPAVPDGSSEA